MDTVRALILSRGLNEQVVKKVAQDKLWHNEVLPHLEDRIRKDRQQPRELRVLFCDDGYGKNAQKQRPWAKEMLQKLFSWCHVVDVRFFTFYDKDNIKMIGRADVFS